METNRNTKAWKAKEDQEMKVMPGITKVHNLIIVDESGSMQSLYNAALTGMNETIQSVKKLGEECPEQAQEVTLVTFDTSHYNKIFDSTPSAEVRELTSADYNPGGCTPLYDAMGKALTELEPKVKEKESVLVTVITDGYENASCEYSLADIRNLVDRLDKKGWLFTYIGANQDAAQVGNQMGISDTLNFEANEHSMSDMWATHDESRKNFVKATRSTGFSIDKIKGKFFNH